MSDDYAPAYAAYCERMREIVHDAAQALKIDNRMSRGHEQAILAHVAALIAGYGAERAGAFIRSIEVNLPLVKVG